MVKNEESKKVYDRAGGYCECGCGKHFVRGKKYAVGFGYQFHHCYRRSEYRGDDRDLAWNLALLADECHIPKIHERQDEELDKRLKSEAYLRLPPEKRSENNVERNKIVYGAGMNKYDKEKAREQRKNNEDYFRKNHGGLSPSQYQYRQQKLYIKKKRDEELRGA